MRPHFLLLAAAAIFFATSDVVSAELSQVTTTQSIPQEVSEDQQVRTCRRTGSARYWCAGRCDREGRQDEDDQWFRTLINNRVIARAHEHDIGAATSEVVARNDDIGTDAVFVTPENATRLAVNNAFVAQTAVMLPTDSFPVFALTDFKGALNGLSNSDIKYVFSLPDNRFGRMAPYLDLILGMPVQVTQNVATTKGVANGTLGTLVAVNFPPDTLFRLVRNGSTNTIGVDPQTTPCLACHSGRTPWESATDPDLFPVFFTTDAYQEVTITLPKAPDGRPRAITVNHNNCRLFVQWGLRDTAVDGCHELAIQAAGCQKTPANLFVSASSDVKKRTGCIDTIQRRASKTTATAINEEVQLNHLSDATLATFQSSLAASTVVNTQT